MRGIRPAVYTLTHKGLMKLRASLKFTKQKTGKVNLPLFPFLSFSFVERARRGTTCNKGLKLELNVDISVTCWPGVLNFL